MILKNEEINLMIVAVKNQIKIVKKDKDCLNFYESVYSKLFSGQYLELTEFSKVRESLINYSRKVKEDETKAKIKILSNKLANYIIDEFDALNRKKK